MYVQNFIFSKLDTCQISELLIDANQDLVCLGELITLFADRDYRHRRTGLQDLYPLVTIFVIAIDEMCVL